MTRRLRLPRSAAGAATALLAALLEAGCGGSDTIDAPDASMPDGDTQTRDAAPADAREADATPSDGRGPDADAGSADADAALPDANVFDSGTGVLAQSLGTASPFVVLSGATITNSGTSTVLLGDIGTTGPSITGLTGPPSQPSGKTEINDARATKAVLDVGTAYASLAGRACPPANDLSGRDLGGMTLAPGVYCFASTAGQSAGSTLTFDAKGDPNAVWILQVKTALTIMDNANAVVIGGPSSLACRIHWTMGTAATLNGGAHSLGNFLASSAISMLANASVDPGRVFGQTAGVTLVSNTISAALCPP